MDEQNVKKQDIQKGMDKVKKGEANLKKKKRKFRKKVSLGALILILAIIISYFLGFRFGSGDGSEGLIGSLMGSESTNDADEDSRNAPDTDSDISRDNSNIPQVIIDENDIIYKGDSITLELLQTRLEEDGVTEVVLVDKASFYQTYQNVADLLTEIGITYTESR